MLTVSFLVLSFLILGCSALDCPECPVNHLPCHNMFLFGGPCPCGGCLTNCYARQPVCPKGEECVPEEVSFGSDKLGDTAVCKPFQQCPQIQCPEGCPESGYFIDINGCATCLCNDPCKELKCPGECLGISVNPGTEPDYKCQ